MVINNEKREVLPIYGLTSFFYLKACDYNGSSEQICDEHVLFLLRYHGGVVYIVYSKELILF